MLHREVWATPVPGSSRPVASQCRSRRNFESPNRYEAVPTILAAATLLSAWPGACRRGRGQRPHGGLAVDHRRRSSRTTSARWPTTPSKVANPAPAAIGPPASTSSSGSRRWACEAAGPRTASIRTSATISNILALVEGRDPELTRPGDRRFSATTTTSATERAATASARSAGSTTAPTTTPAAWPGCWKWPRPCRSCPRSPGGRSLFAFWDGEEKGLLGSQALGRAPHGAAQARADHDQRRHDRPAAQLASSWSMARAPAAGLRRLVSRQNDPVATAARFHLGDEGRQRPLHVLFARHSDR